jgi:hypothetical protein
VQPNAENASKQASVKFIKALRSEHMSRSKRLILLAPGLVMIIPRAKTTADDAPN